MAMQSPLTSRPTPPKPRNSPTPNSGAEWWGRPTHRAMTPPAVISSMPRQSSMPWGSGISGAPAFLELTSSSYCCTSASAAAAGLTGSRCSADACTESFTISFLLFINFHSAHGARMASTRTLKELQAQSPLRSVCPAPPPRLSHSVRLCVAFPPRRGSISGFWSDYGNENL